MRLDPSSKRKEFFSIPSAAQILRRQAIEPSVFSGFQEVQDLLNQERLVSGATEGHAGAAIRGWASQNSFVSALDRLLPGQTLVLPDSAYVHGGERGQVGRLRNYTDSAFLNLESRAVGRAVTGDASFERWTDYLRIEHDAAPLRLLRSAVDLESRDAMREPLMGLQYGDNRVEWAHNAFGFEQRVWQNFWGYFKGIERHEQRLEDLVLQERESGVDLSHLKRDSRNTIRLYEQEVEKYGIDSLLDVLTDHGHDVLGDVIEPDGEPGLRTAYYGQNLTVQAPTYWRMQVFRRASPDERRLIEFTGLPVVPRRFAHVTPALTHKMAVAGEAGHEVYGNMAQKGRPWIAEAIAGAHTVSRIVNKADETVFYDYDAPEGQPRYRAGAFSVGQLPFPLLTPEGVEAADKIRYQTVFLSEDEDGRVVSRSANLATFSKLFGAKLLHGGYDSVLGSRQEIKARRVDPMQYAVSLDFDECNP